LSQHGGEISSEGHVGTYEHTIATHHCKAHALVVRVAHADGEAASLHLGCEIKNSEHLHAVGRYCVFVVDNSDVPEPERLDESLDDLVMRDRAVGFGCWRCRYQHQFFAGDGPPAIANERTCF